MMGSKKHLLLILISVMMFSCRLRNPEAVYNQAKEEHAPFDVIIVPGFPFEDSLWQNEMKYRMYWAKFLWDNNMTNNIIFSGGAVYTKYAECKIMRLYALEMGIPDEHIFMDSIAEHSTENVYYSYYLAKHLGFEKIALATDKYQAIMLHRFVNKMNRKVDAEIKILPAIQDSVFSLSVKDYNIEYKKAETPNFINITEKQSFWYRMKGTLGMNINWDNPPEYEAEKNDVHGKASVDEEF